MLEQLAAQLAELPETKTYADAVAGVEEDHRSISSSDGSLQKATQPGGCVTISVSSCSDSSITGAAMAATCSSDAAAASSCALPPLRSLAWQQVRHFFLDEVTPSCGHDLLVQRLRHLAGAACAWLYPHSSAEPGCLQLARGVEHCAAQLAALLQELPEARLRSLTLYLCSAYGVRLQVGDDTRSTDTDTAAGGGGLPAAPRAVSASPSSLAYFLA